MTRMRLAAARVVAPAALGIALLGIAPARAQQGGVAERAGTVLDDTGRAIKRGVQGGFARARARAQAMEMVDRVYSRLHWEKALAGATVEVEVQPGGIAIVRGVVPSVAAKAKAVGLARDTIGVVQVVDELSVAAPAPPTAPAPVVEPAATRPIP